MAEGILPFQDLGKQQLLERCRELEFVDDVEDLKCTRCNRLALEHWYTNCGHALCPNCKRLLSGGGFKCPKCSQFIKHIAEQSADFEKRVNGLRVKCPNSGYGCSLITTVKQLKEHVVGCEWTKEQIFPAVYRGTNTMQMLLDEVSSLKEQMGEMKGTIGFLLNKLNKRLKAEADIKKSVEMSVEDIKSFINGLSSDLTLDVNHKITTMEKSINEINLEKLKANFVSKEELKQMEDKIVSANANGNKILIQMLDQKEDRFSEKLTKEVETINTKIVTSEGKLEIVLTNIRQETADIFKLQIKEFEEKMRIKKDELDKKMNSELEKLEMTVEKCRKEMGHQEVERHLKGSIEKYTEEINNQMKQLSSQLHNNTTQMSHDIQSETEKLKEEIYSLNVKISKIEKNMDDVSKWLYADVLTIQKLNPQLKPIEAFDRRTAIKNLLSSKLSLNQLADNFLFGSISKKMIFESLCFKWNNIHFEQLVPEEGSREHMSDIFPVYGYQLKAQLKLIINSHGDIQLHLCFKDDERTGQEVDIQVKPKVAYIIKDLSGYNRHLIRYFSHTFNQSLQYNIFGYRRIFEKSKWKALMSPRDKSMEVLVLVEPPTISNKLLSSKGTITDTIEHYSRKLQMTKNGFFYSHLTPPFLTHAGGFRVAVEMCLNEPIRNNMRGLKALIWFLSGEFDSQMGREFKHETNITLINRFDLTKNFTVKKQANNITYYSMDIASVDTIGLRGFLLNDSLIYHVTIMPIQL